MKSIQTVCVKAMRVISLLCAGLISVQAQISTSFEGAEYISGSRLSTITDSQIGTVWTVYSSNGTVGTTGDAVVTTAHPADGLKNLRLTDTDATKNMSARISLASTMPSANLMTISFKLSLSSITGTNGVVNILLGDGPALSTATNNWLYLGVNGANDSTAPNTLSLNYRTTAGGATSSFYLKNANATVYNFVDSQYLDLSFAIDKTTNQYTSIKLNGVEQLGLGANPATPYIYATTTPGSVFQFYTTSGATGTVDIDSLSVVPEPSTFALLGTALLSGLVWGRRQEFGKR